MKVKRLVKGGKTRIVYCTRGWERHDLLRLLPLLAQAERRAASAAGTEAVAHAFVQGRSAVTCARRHQGMAVTISCDMAGWFDSVTPQQVAAGLELAGFSPPLAALTIARSVCRVGVPDGPRPGQMAPRQGLPTSPAACNLAGVALDRHLLRLLQGLPCEWVYTRYADDLVVSLKEDWLALNSQVLAEVGVAVLAQGWKLHPGKTRVQHAVGGRRVVVGVAVDETLCFPTRKARRKLRAAQHNDPKSNRARGLLEWCLLRKPKDPQ